MMVYNPAEVLKFREQKALFFRRNRNAPLRANEVTGMRYFAVSSDYVFNASLELFEAEQRVWLATSLGDAEAYFRYARACFVFEGEEHCLTVYLPEGSDDASRVFIPFTDLTNAVSSYEGGRYVEASPEGAELKLDFNFAYNPYCAYSERFRCPIPPAENALGFSVKAGEMKYER